MSDENFITNYFSSVGKVINNLDEHKEKIIDIINKIRLCNENENKVLVAGNGGSCADAEHFAGELVCTFNDRNRKGISAIPLATHPAALTAWSNDFGFESYFERQIESNGKKGDILFLLSTGGGDLKNKASLNLVFAAQKALKKKLTVISLVGKEGGELKKISNIYIHVKNKDTSIIQEAHMSILHCICIGLDSKL
jgi:D-sedoheptulose 7-phosphate isomerase